MATPATDYPYNDQQFWDMSKAIEVPEEESEFRPAESLGTIMQLRALQIDERRKEPEKWAPIPTGFDDLDKYVLGFPQEPFYWLLTADEKIGKTTIGQNLVEAWRKGLPVAEDGTKEKILYVQLEELRHQYADRTFARLTSLTKDQIRSLNINDEQMEEIYKAADEISQDGDNLYISDDMFGLDAVVLYGLSIGITKFVFDSLNLFDRDNLPGKDDREKIAALSKKMVKYRNKKSVSCIMITHEGGNSKAFGSTQPDKDADIRTRIGYVYEDAPSEEGKKTKKNPVIVEGQRRIFVQPSRLCKEGYADMAFDGSKNKISPITRVDINSDAFLEALKKEGPNGERAQVLL